MRLAFSITVAFSLMLTSCADSDPDPTDSSQDETAAVDPTTTDSAATDEADQTSSPNEVQVAQTSHGNGQNSHANHDGHAPRQGHGNESRNVAEHKTHGERGGRTGHSEGHGKNGDGKNTHGKDGHNTRPATPVAQTPVPDDLKDSDAATIFNRRILPILQAENSSSCTACHFVGVELRDFILEDQAQTFASLKADGLIDVKRPDESKILRFIGRKPEKPDPLIEKVRQQEFIAFRSWIRAAVREPELLKATSNVEVGTKLPPEVIRHARSDRVLSSFVDNIWSEMGRCVNCHSPERNRKKIGRNGLTREDVDAISWIVPRDPESTLRKLVESGNIDTVDPELSQVLTKPCGQEEHGGGPKFFPGSPTYRKFLAFLTDFAATTNSEYKTAKDLPAPPEELILLTEQQLRITDIPAAYSGMALQVDLYRRNGDSRT